MQLNSTFLYRLTALINIQIRSILDFANTVLMFNVSSCDRAAQREVT